MPKQVLHTLQPLRNIIAGLWPLLLETLDLLLKNCQPRASVFQGLWEAAFAFNQSALRTRDPHHLSLAKYGRAAQIRHYLCD